MPRKNTKLQKLSESIPIALEEIRGLGIENLDRMFMEEYLEQADQLTDTRQQAKVWHPLKDVIGIVFFAPLAGNDEWTEIADFAVDEKETLEKYLELPRGIPSHDTIQRVFFILRPDEPQRMLVNILIQLITVAGKCVDEYLYRNDALGCCIRDVIAADGKETRNTAKKNSTEPEASRNLNEFNVMSTEWGICLSSTRIDEKSNEIPEMQRVIKQTDCRGCIVTADAMNTQKATARAIVKEAHGEYCLALKENQKTACQEIKEYFGCEEFLNNLTHQDGRYLKETEHTASLITTREYFITDDIRWFEDREQWEKLSAIGYERKTIIQKETDSVHVEERYYLCSIPPVADLFATAIRRHWHIENGLHWTLDVVFREDKLRSKEKNGIHNLGLVRRFMMFIIKLLKVYYQRSMKRIRNKIGRNLETEIPVILAVLKVLYDNEMLDTIDELAKIGCKEFCVYRSLSFLGKSSIRKILLSIL